jgi:retron-type reverse transcriptase
LEYIRRAVLPRAQAADGRRHRLPYKWVIEGDIKSCFDNINHHHLLDQLRNRVADRKVIRLVGQFLKAGVLSEQEFYRTETGTPQGGIISPLLANIALSAIEARYARWVDQRTKIQARRTCDGVSAARHIRNSDRAAGRSVFLPVRYADDFVVLISGTEEDAVAETAALAEHLSRITGLELSPEKTKITVMTDGSSFSDSTSTCDGISASVITLALKFPKHKSLIFGIGSSSLQGVTAP